MPGCKHGSQRPTPALFSPAPARHVTRRSAQPQCPPQAPPHWAASFVYLIWPGPNTLRPPIGRDGASLTRRHSGPFVANKLAHSGYRSSGPFPELAPRGPGACTLRRDFRQKSTRFCVGKVGASQGRRPEARKTAGLACPSRVSFLPNPRNCSGLLCTRPSARPGWDPLPKCAMRSGCWGDSEGFLEAVISSRVLKGKFIYSLNEYRRLLFARSLGPRGIVLLICAKTAGTLFPKECAHSPEGSQPHPGSPGS